MSRLADEYGLDVWIWYPAMDRDYGNPKTVEFAAQGVGAGLQEALPRIDAIFVPGGDPGHTQPKHLMALLEKQTALLHKYHPKAQMWVSPQSFNQAWLDEFYEIVQSRARMAGRHRVWPAGAREPAGTAPRRFRPAIRFATIPTSRTAASANIRCPTGTWRTRSRRAARHQPAAAGRGHDLSPVAAIHDRLSHLFRRLQRRRQQGRVERAGLESRRPGGSTSCASSAATTLATTTPRILPRA